MGQEAECIVHLGRERAAGKARLEHDRLTFRGAFSLTIALAEIQAVAAGDGVLEVAYPGGPARFELGGAAERWAAKLRTPPTLMDKLGVKPGSRVTVLGVSDEAFWQQLRTQTTDIAAGRRRKGADLIFLQADRRGDLARLGTLKDDISPHGAIWVIAPKGGGEPRETDVLAGGRAAGLVDIKVAAFSSTHTAHKFVIPRGRRRGVQAPARAGARSGREASPNRAMVRRGGQRDEE